jgi:hypothetical protein
MEEEYIYTEAELISFGNFLLETFDDQVTKEDVANWRWKLEHESEE